MKVDLNCDMGESFGVYTLGVDAEIMPFITSANIACGFHGGDPNVMSRTVALAKQFGVGIGAHPGYPDLAGFGRRVLHMSESEIENMMLYQLGALWGLTRAYNATLRHVKPHGALYNLAVQDLKVARAITRAVARFDSKLILVGLPDSGLSQAANEFGLPFAREGFIDRAYKADGTLLPRGEAGAVLTSATRAADRAKQMVLEKRVMSIEGKLIPLEVDTLCIHGDTPHALEIARAVFTTLRDANVQMKPMLWTN